MMKKSKVIPLLEIIIGSILLVREIYDFFTLPGLYNDNELVDYSKYKEETYAFSFLWALIIIVGILSLQNQKLKWNSHQVLIIFFLTISLILFIAIFQTQQFIVVIFGIFITGLIILEIVLYRKKLRARLNITPSNVIMSIMMGILCTLIFLLLFPFVL